MKHIFYWIALISLGVSIGHLLNDNIELAINDVLLAILNMLLAIFWQLEERT
jgi:uncharacterized membrane-anchored protein